MLRIRAIVDKEGTALDRLAKGVAKYHDNLDYKVIACHPKRPSLEQLVEVERECRTADIIDSQYYKSMDMLRQRFEWLRDIPTIQTMNNPYAIHERDWNDYDVVVANNKTMFSDLEKITTSRLEHIPLVADPYFWTYKEDYEAPSSVIMVANRIEGKKGILPVAKACKELGIKMYLVGAISDPAYWQEIMATGVVHFAQQVSDEELRDLYHKSGIHVCNSVDNFESGTLPILEAIFCGIPVMTRKIGHVPDFAKEDNIVINDHNNEDVDHIVDLLSQMFADKKQLQKQRHEAWMAIKDRNFERRAYLYQKLYRDILGGKPVSVIVPVAGKEDVTRSCLNAIANQGGNLEIIVVDDGEIDQKANIDEIGKTLNFPVRYIRLGGLGYNLAKARNLAAIEATGDILIFCDQRMIMEKDCILNFIEQLKPKYWLWGNKGSKKDFIENLSCIYREDFMTFGGFNERIDKYGGMSQEARSRARRQLITLEYVDNAKATPLGKSNNKYKKRLEILEMKTKLWKCGLL